MARRGIITYPQSFPDIQNDIRIVITESVTWEISNIFEYEIKYSVNQNVLSEIINRFRIF